MEFDLELKIKFKISCSDDDNKEDIKAKAIIQAEQYRKEIAMNLGIYTQVKKISSININFDKNE